MAAALSVAFLAGSLTFGSTASAYMIDVGMADLAAKEKAENEKKAEQLKKEQKAAEQQAAKEKAAREKIEKEKAAKEKAERDKAAKEKAAREKKAAAEREAEQKRLKEQNSKLENKQESRKNEPEIRLLQDKKEAPAEVKTTPKTNAVDEAMKAMEEAAQDSNTAALGNKKAAEPKTVATEKKAEETKLPAQQNKASEPKTPVQQNKAAEPKTPAQQNKPEARNTVTENKTTQEAKPVQQSKKEEPKSGESKADKKQKDAKKERFQEILRDESFVYYMDTQSARYVPIPNRQDRMIDVWVKLVPNSFTQTAVGQPGKYYLEHYYINPKEREIQFLCELEVTGRPSNSIKERPYNSQNWEKLVPGSVEDDIYHSVVKKVKSSSGIGGSMTPSFSDILDTLNIGL